MTYDEFDALIERVFEQREALVSHICQAMEEDVADVPTMAQLAPEYGMEESLAD